MILIGCLFALLSIAQENNSVASHRGKSSAEALRDYGIELTEPSLVAALGNPNPKVRVDAAMVLAEVRDFDKIPAIQRAFAAEQNSMTRLGLASALASLHDASGIQYLQATCANSASSAREVFPALWALDALSLPSSGCADNLLSLIDRDVDERDALLSLLPDVYRGATPEDSERILKTAEGMLLDVNQQPSVRLAAGSSLAQMGAPSSVETIRSALSREADPTMRSSFELNLRTIEKKIADGNSSN